MVEKKKESVKKKKTIHMGDFASSLTNVTYQPASPDSSPPLVS